ncbi:hypothetical protein WJX84_011973 [Apatococcus fuscideae]|uniref:Uncharacterized protein n=1 Tax=Apatococcus fuscideae TaxID=2026836 RepID=A0AAW1STP8_9CHLO
MEVEMPKYISACACSPVCATAHLSLFAAQSLGTNGGSDIGPLVRGWGHAIIPGWKEWQIWSQASCTLDWASKPCNRVRVKMASSGRRLDYWAIGVSTAFLQRELNPKLSKWVTGASLAVTPFRPFIVSAGNTAALEVRYALRAKRDASFRRKFIDHVSCGAAGMTCFYLEEHYPDNPCIHPAWHVLAALSVQSIRPLIDDIEERRGAAATAKGSS